MFLGIQNQEKIKQEPSLPFGLQWQAKATYNIAQLSCSGSYRKTSSGDLLEIYAAETAQNFSKLRAFILKVSEHLSTAWTRTGNEGKKL